MATPAQRLQDHCAPLFLYLATFRRNAKTSTLEIAELRSGLERELQKVQDACAKDHELTGLWDRLRYALVTTADQVILASPWPNRAGWSMQLQEAEVYGTMEGGKRFFQLVEQTLADGSKDAAALAHILFHCMGLGFQGELRNDRAELNRLRQQLFDKAQLPSQMGSRLTPESYDRNSNKSTLKLPTVGIYRLMLVGVAAIVFALVLGNASTGLSISDVSDKVEEVKNELRGKD